MRDTERKQQDAQDAAFKKRREALGDVSAVNLEPDDGLTPGERSVKQSVAREKAAKQAKDIELDEAAHILADAAVMIERNPTLAREVLPAQAFEKPVAYVVAQMPATLPPASAASGATAGKATAPAATPAPASAVSAGRR